MMNPYLPDIGNQITRQVTDNYNQNVLPGINQNAQFAGGYGGSRQGVAQGLAASRMNQDITGQLASLYGQAYEGDQNRNVSMRGQDQNFYTNQRGQDLSQQQLAGNQLEQAQRISQNQNSYLYNAGQQQLMAPWQPLQNYANTLNPFTGLNQSTTTPGGGGGIAGALGGGLTAAQLWQLFTGGG